MTSREWHDFRELLAERTGLLLRERDLKEVGDTLAGRWRVLRLSRIEEYLSLLQSDTPRSIAEWKRLMPLVTNGESYFLRDTGQHDLLRAQLLPELIERGRARRVLRVWSAGCSNGEEA
jgi:chemotaxis protein methyltransferase CheR